jgi:hypothetical protein
MSWFISKSSRPSPGSTPSAFSCGSSPGRAPLPLRFHEILPGRGPFSLAEERHPLQRNAIDVMISKASGGSATEAKIITTPVRCEGHCGGEWSGAIGIAKARESRGEDLTDPRMISSHAVAEAPSSRPVRSVTVDLFPRLFVLKPQRLPYYKSKTHGLT